MRPFLARERHRAGACYNIDVPSPCQICERTPSRPAVWGISSQNVVLDAPSSDFAFLPSQSKQTKSHAHQRKRHISWAGLLLLQRLIMTYTTQGHIIRVLLCSTWLYTNTSVQTAVIHKNRLTRKENHG